MAQEIHIFVEPDGKLTTSVSGVKGSGCHTLTADLEKLGKVLETKETAEAKQSVTGTQQQSVRG